MPVAESEPLSATVGPVNCCAGRWAKDWLSTLLDGGHERYVSTSSDYSGEASEPLVATDGRDVLALTDARNAL